MRDALGWALALVLVASAACVDTPPDPLQLDGGILTVDNRSFEHNDEVNVALRDPAVAARLLEDYRRDVENSEAITLEQWRRRPFWEKIVGPFVWILERQQ